MGLLTAVGGAAAGLAGAAQGAVALAAVARPAMLARPTGLAGLLAARSAPASAGWLQVSADGYHSCAIQTDHTLYCWGSNYFGQLGIGSAVHHHDVPVPVWTRANWCQGSARGGFSC